MKLNVVLAILMPVRALALPTASEPGKNQVEARAEVCNQGQ
jgi:hypothetical protein